MLNIRIHVVMILAFARGVSTAVALSYPDKPVKLLVPPSRKINAMQELVAYAKANPATANNASTVTHTSSHPAGFLLAKKAAFSATHLQYKGAGAVLHLLAGRVQFMFATIASESGHIRAGTLTAITE